MFDLVNYVRESSISSLSHKSYLCLPVILFIDRLSCQIEAKA